MSDWKKIEAVLFASGSYLDKEKLEELTGLKNKKLAAAIEECQRHYENLDCSLEITTQGESYKLSVKGQFSDLVQNVVSGVEMPKPIMETLALIAYRSPVLQSDIITDRGAHCYDHIAFLETKKFISKEKYGRTYKLRITEKFNDYFDIDDSRIRELFANIKKPEVEVEEETENDTDFEEAILQRMKKPQEEESEEEVETFLNDIESRLEDVKTRVSNTEKELDSLKPQEEESEEDDEEIKRL